MTRFQASHEGTLSPVRRSMTNSTYPSALGLRSLNLAVGGTGPGIYTLYERLIEAMNRGRFVILQCMAARHAGNSRFEPRV